MKREIGSVEDYKEKGKLMIKERKIWEGNS